MDPMTVIIMRTKNGEVAQAEKGFDDPLDALAYMTREIRDMVNLSRLTLAPRPDEYEIRLVVRQQQPSG